MTEVTLDHLVIAAETLEDGVAHVEATLGVPMAGGGKHEHMGTHNRLLALGEAYLEVIAIDPDAPAPGRARMFALDEFRGPPRLTNWVVRTPDLRGALALAPAGAGQVMALSRGDFRWTMSVPEDGHLPFAGGFPGLIQWEGDLHPTDRLPEAQCRLEVFQVVHPEAETLREALDQFEGGLGACVAQATLPGFRAAISTPAGLEVLT